MAKNKEVIEPIKLSEAISALTEFQTPLLGLTGGLKFQLEIIEECVTYGNNKEAAILAVKQIRQAFEAIKPFIHS